MERKRSLSQKRGTSKGGTSTKDKGEAAETVNITKVNKGLDTTPPRPATAQTRGRQPAETAATAESRPATAGAASRERSLYEKKQAREMALKMLELEEEKEEAESQAKIEAALVQREKFLSKNR